MVLRHRLIAVAERVRLFSPPVHLHNLECALSGDCHEVCCEALVGGICHKTCQDICLEEEVVAIHSLQHHFAARQFAACLYVAVHLIVETAFQFGTHSCELLRIERDVLISGCSCAHRHEVLHPCGATQFSAARSCSADASCFLSGSDLFHLDTHMESLGKHLDKLAEVHSLIGDIIENRLVAVALILHITDFHLQVEVFGYLSALNHGAVFAALRLAPFVDIHWFRYAIYALDVVHRLEVRLLDLQFHELSRERHHSDIMTRTCLHSHHIALLQIEGIDIMVISLSGVLELHFNKVCALGISRHISEPVVCIQLAVLPSAASSAESARTTVANGEFHILEVHIVILFSLLIKYCVCIYIVRASHPECHFCMSSTIVFSAMSKNTILAFAFCPMSRIPRS